MKKADYRIIHQHSQLTLNNLTAPYYHENKGCQFNFFELDKSIQVALEQDESKQFICPVCHQKGLLKLDVLYLQIEFQNEQNQLVVNLSNGQILQIQKLDFTHSFLSKEKEVFELQQQFNSQILLNNNFQNQLTLKYLEKLNSDRNNEIFQIFRRNCQNNLPTLIGVANFKLILFYHLSKIKLEFDIYDKTDKKNSIKIHDYNAGNIKIKQVDLIKNYIYLIIQQENLQQLYRGSLNQIFDEDRNETIFYVQQMPGYTLLGESRLLQFQNKNSLMIGNTASIIVNENIDKNVEMDENIKIPELNENSQVAVLLDQQILFVDYSKMIESGIGIIREYKYNEKQIIETKQNNIYNQINENDLSIVHNQILYLLNSERLNNQNIQVLYVMPNRDRNQFSKKMKIINHHSYMKVKIIPTTQTAFKIMSCILIGLMFQSSQIIFPAVLVFNENTNLIEIELI